MKWGWVITKDRVSVAFSGWDRTGVGRGDDPMKDVVAAKSLKFRLRDDDREIYYEGVLIDDDYCESQIDALDFGMADAGCSYIEVKRNGKWVIEID